MNATHSRVHVDLEPKSYQALTRLARREHVPVSQKARDLLLGALELLEDTTLDAMATERRRGYDPKKALTLDELRRRLGATDGSYSPLSRAGP